MVNVVGQMRNDDRLSLTIVPPWFFPRQALQTNAKTGQKYLPHETGLSRVRRTYGTTLAKPKAISEVLVPSKTHAFKERSLYGLFPAE